MHTQFRKAIFVILIASFAIGATACNTMHGIGKDTERAGEKIQKESDEHRHHDNDRP